MECGTTERFDCTDCATEFVITLEPKYRGDKTNGGDAKPVEYCPFCGSMSGVLAEGEENDEDDDGTPP